MRKSAIIILIFLIVISFLSAAEKEIKLDRFFDFKGAKSVEIDLKLVNGKLRIYTWDRKEAKVEGIVRYRGEKPEIELKKIGDQLILRIEKEKGWWFFRRSPGRKELWADITVFLPEPFEGKAGVTNGRIELKSIIGKKNGYVKLSTVNGIVRILELKSEELKVSNINGRIMISETFAEEANLSTVNGKIEATGFFASHLKVKTVNGDIEIGLEEKPLNKEGYWKLSSVNGDIYLGFLNEPEFYYDFKIKSVSGDVYVELSGVDISSTTVFSKASFELNGGKKAKMDIFADVNTVSGDVEIRRESK